MGHKRLRHHHDGWAGTKPGINAEFSFSSRNCQPEAGILKAISNQQVSQDGHPDIIVEWKSQAD
jgi:hypothetical protein